MLGHHPIVAMRKRGIRPVIVFLNDYPDAASKDWQNPGEKYGEKWPADHATVSVYGDVIELLDLRFLVGLCVSISSLSEARAKALFERCKAAGASTVAASHVVPGWAIYRSSWADIFRKPEVANA